MASSTVQHIAILGAGLMGGSLALSIQDKLPSVTYALWDKDPQAIHTANKLGCTNTGTNLEQAIHNADMIILAVPVGAMEEIISQIIAAQTNNTQANNKNRPVLITDIGSVKRLPHSTIEPLIKNTQFSYIGSHPMAGSEKRGISAADATLLENAACILTGADATWLPIITEFWQNLGCKVHHLSPKDHDYIIARVSHFPHLLACVGAKIGLADEGASALAGTGLKDTTRIAAGNPELWTEIILENKDAIIPTLHESLLETQKLITILEQNNPEQLNEYLHQAKQKRDLI